MSIKPSLSLLAIAMGCAAPLQANTATPDYGPSPAGFYQILEHRGELFAAFGGTLENYMLDPVTYPAGTTPGAVFIFDAGSLRLKQEIPLQSIGGALTLDKAGNRLLIGHTHDHAFTAMDLDTRETRHHVLDTRVDEAHHYRIRYLATDSDGGIYVSAFDWHLPLKHTVLKFRPDGTRDASFQPQAFEGFSIPLTVTQQFNPAGNTQVLFGSPRPRLVNSATGALEYEAASPIRRDAAEQTNLYNYVAGPGNTVIATNAPHFMDGNQGDYNLYQFELGKEQEPERLFTAATALEAIYNPDAGQLYATSFGNRLLSIVALDEHTPLGASRFENIRLPGGTPSNIAMRRTAHGTELFITLRLSANQVARIQLAGNVKGIEGLRAPGACLVTVWDLQQRSAGEPLPCEFMDIVQQFQENLAAAQAFAHDSERKQDEAEQALAASQAGVQQARLQLQAAPDDPALKKAAQMAEFQLAMNAFILDILQRAGSNAPHVVQGARQFLEQLQAR